METVVFILMMLVCFNYLLKQTSRKFVATVVSAAACALFTGAMWPYAIEQSKTQIADWLADPALMLDTAVVLSLEVVVQMAYCLLAVHVRNSGPLPCRTLRIYRALRWFPGVLIYGVLFSALVSMIFAFPGASFRLVAWATAAGVFVVVLGGRWLLCRALEEKELRLELLFLSNALIAMLGVIATVNGRTAIVAESRVDWAALAGVLGLVAAGTLVGALLRRRRMRRMLARKERTY